MRTSPTTLTSVLKRGVRRTAWLGYNLFMVHMFPIVAGAVTRAAVGALRSKMPQTSSPWLTGEVLVRKTADGAILAGLRTPLAWAKYALPKGLPVEGKVLAIENEPHLVDDFSGEIAEGYGKGVKTLLLSDSVIIKVNGRTSVQKINYHVHKTTRSGGRDHYDLVVTGVPSGTKQWELNIPRGMYKGRYAFIEAGQGTIVTRMTDHGLQLPKPNYTLRQEDRLENLDPKDFIIERKIDGSLGNAHITGQRVAFRSHREGGETYYDRLPTVEFLRNESSFLVSRTLYPGPQLSGTVFQGELAHQDGSARVAGILNSLPKNARIVQQQRGPVRYYVWDILKYKGRDVSTWPYEERRQLYLKLVDEIRQVNKFWDVVEAAPPEESPNTFYKRVTSDPLPWGEGVVVKGRAGSLQKWDKIKMHGFGYFKLVEILPGEGKYANSVGRLVVENPSNNARGEVGSLAVPDEFRNWMWAHRSDLEGETVKVRSQEITSRGVPRAGVFYGFHDSEVDLLMAAEAGAAGTNKSARDVMYAMKSANGWRKK